MASDGRPDMNSDGIRNGIRLQMEFQWIAVGFRTTVDIRIAALGRIRAAWLKSTPRPQDSPGRGLASEPAGDAAEIPKASSTGV
jgi:hypothetical protein